MADHRIDLQPDKRKFGPDTMLFHGRAIGKSERPIYDAARWLLANNAAAEDDTVATYRGGTLSMHGKVGELAKWTVIEHADPGKHGRPTLELVRWRPFPTHAVGARTGETPERAGLFAQARAGGLLGELLFGSLDSTQSACQAEYPGNYRGTWRCIRTQVARGHTGDMNNGAAVKYLATGDMLFARVQAGQMDDATATYYLASALSQGDMEYEATHQDTTTVCNTIGYTTICN